MMEIVFNFMSQIDLWTWGFFLVQLSLFCVTISRLSGINKLLKGKLLSTKTEGIVHISIDNKETTFLKDINSYLLKNNGTADFSIIQNKTERYVSMHHEKAVSLISFPVYLGLMGTFLGVLMGLLGFNDGQLGEQLVTDERIQQLIQGVVVSMSTSLWGLFLTTIANFYSAKVKSELNKRKQGFYNFLVEEVLPELGTSMVAVLGKLRTTINKFEPAFSAIINSFKETFETCTSQFGESFRENVSIVSNAVTVMGENMSLVNQNVYLQQQLLEALKTNETNQTLTKFIEASKNFERINYAISQLILVKDELVAKTENLVLNTGEIIKTQAEYKETMELPLNVAEKMNEILNRFSTFEESINGLGNCLNETQFFRYSEIKAIQAQIASINEKARIAEDFENIAEERLHEAYDAQVSQLQNIGRNYSEAIEAQKTSFDNVMTEMSQLIEKHKEVFVSKMKQFVDENTLYDGWSNLKHLTEIEMTIKQLSETVDGIKKDLSNRHISHAISVPNGQVQKDSEDNAQVRQLNSLVNHYKKELEVVKKELKELSAQKENVEEEKKGNSWFEKVGKVLKGKKNG